MNQSQVSQLLRDASTSYWLKEAIQINYDRDIVDAIHDAETLLAALNSKLAFTNEINTPAKQWLDKTVRRGGR